MKKFTVCIFIIFLMGCSTKSHKAQTLVTADNIRNYKNESLDKKYSYIVQGGRKYYSVDSSDIKSYDECYKPLADNRRRIGQSTEVIHKGKMYYLILTNCDK